MPVLVQPRLERATDHRIILHEQYPHADLLAPVPALLHLRRPPAPDDAGL
jgi:hypothetical protein